ncbi:MAG: DUF3050 domain-containing protein [Sediminibacterium sp.]
MNQQIDRLKDAIEPSRATLLQHPVYHQIQTLEALKKFAEVHVFAVWDFMSLLKSLQQKLTCVQTPWVPIGSAKTRYLINEIVLGEESDVDEFDNRISHFELYLQSMGQMGASTNAIVGLLQALQTGTSIEAAIKQLDSPASIKDFLNFTFKIVNHMPAHVQAAVFTFGREDLIPDMFTRLLEKLVAESPEKVSIFKYYIERHIEVDGGHHSHLALEMVAELCGDDEVKWKEAEQASLEALQIRAKLWDAVTA